MSTYNNRRKDREQTLAFKAARKSKSNMAEMGGNF